MSRQPFRSMLRAAIALVCVSATSAYAQDMPPPRPKPTEPSAAPEPQPAPRAPAVECPPGTRRSGGRCIATQVDCPEGARWDRTARKCVAAETAESPDRAPALQPRAGESPAATGDMVRVPAGPFFMGCNETVDRECDDDEKPGRTVTAAAFRIDRTEVTVAAYQACVAAGGCSEPGDSGSCTWGKAGQENHPINCIDWEQARAYCAWAGKRLPTAAEWEKAARGTDGRKYPGGNEEPENRMANLGGSHDGFAGTAPVGSFPAGASPYGALDMSGNVFEWIDDSNGEGRGVRGGSWLNVPRYARASSRSWLDPRYRFENIGLRCAQ